MTNDVSSIHSSIQPYGQCIKPQRIDPDHDTSTAQNSAYPQLTTTNVIDFAAKTAKVAVSTGGKAVKAVDKNHVIPRRTAPKPSTDGQPGYGNEKVLWVSIDDSVHANCCACEVLARLGRDGHVNRRPVFLYIGYTAGYSIWLVAADSDAYEILSNRSGPVIHVKILPTPSKLLNLSSHTSENGSMRSSVSNGSDITYNSSSSLESAHFPHMATVAAGSTDAECELIISSLIKNPQTDPAAKVHSISFPSKINQIECNRKILVISLENGQLAGFHLHTNYTPVFSLERNPMYQAISLGDRWLAFNEKTKCAKVFSRGGSKTFNDTQSLASNVLKTFYSVYSMAETAYKETTKQKSPGSQELLKRNDLNEAYASCVDIDTLCEFGEEQTEVETDELGETRPVAQSVMFHFIAHKQTLAAMPTKSKSSSDGKSDGGDGERIRVTCLSFDESGTMLATADNRGHVFNVFKLHANINSSASARVTHLYCLRRGETEAGVTGLKWSLDSRLIAASTERGTTHIFPIVPEYGGEPSLRSHGKQYIQNRYTSYERSAGLSDLHTQLNEEMSESFYEKEPVFVDTAAYIRNQTPVEATLVGWSKSGDSILVLDHMAKLTQITISTGSGEIDGERQVGQEKGGPLSVGVQAVKVYNLKRRADWSSVTAPLPKLSPVVLYSDFVTGSCHYNLSSDSSQNSWVLRYLTNLHNYRPYNVKSRNRTSSWNFGKTSSETSRNVHRRGTLDDRPDTPQSQDNSMMGSLADQLPEAVSTVDLTRTIQSGDWLKHLEVITCEMDMRALLSGPQFTIVKVDQTAEAKPSATATRSKKKKGKKTDDGPETVVIADDNGRDDETIRKALDLMDAMMDEDGECKNSQRSSVSHFKVDDEIHCDLAIEIQSKTRVTRKKKK